MGTTNRGFTVGRLGLLLDGVFVGSPMSCDHTAYVIPPPPFGTPPDHVITRPPGQFLLPKPDLVCGLGMSKGFYDWLKTSCNYGCAGRSCDILLLDDSNAALRRDSLTLALITQVTFPACDASSKDASTMTITLSVSSLQTKQGSGQYPGAIGNTGKRWLASNFKLEIDGLDVACKQVSKIDPIKLQRGKPPVIQLTAAPGLPAAHVVQAFNVWKIRNDKRGGSLDYLTPDGQQSLFRLSFEGLQVQKIAYPGSVSLRCGRATLVGTPS